ncbi:hypothetical protein AX14_004169 [Amanita brunnescens Koide BX004]|nr:hypothetical protein AX14_004169 [Amanita brunnescens Koide BX004]
MRFPLIRSMHVESSCKAGIEPKTPVQMATKRRAIKTSAASTSSVEDQQPAPPQVQSSRFPGGMGEERLAYDTVVIKINNENIKEHLPKAAVTPAPPTHLPTTPIQAATLHHPLDEGVPLIEVAPKQGDLCIIDTKPLLSDLHSWKIETVRKQSEPTRTPSFEGEGKYLERAAAYVREHMSRRTSACDTFAPRTQREPPDKLTKPDARRRGQEVVRANTTSVALHSPDGPAARAPLTFKPSLPTSVSPASLNNDPGSGDQTTMKYHASVDDDKAKAGRSALQVVSRENEASVTRSPEIKHEGARTSRPRPRPNAQSSQCPLDPPSEKTPEGKPSELLVETVEICECSDECSPKDVELVQRVPKDFKSPDRADIQYRWPSQEAINNEESSVLLHSQESTVALIPITPEPVNPAYSRSRSSPELKFWLRWKPPDTGENSTRPSTTICSANSNTSVMCSPLYGTALMLPVFPLASLARVTSPCRRNNELVPRVRKLPNAIGCWLQTEAVNKTEEGWKRGHLPVLRPTFYPFTRLPLRWSALTSLADCYICETSVVRRANGKGCC